MKRILIIFVFVILLSSSVLASVECVKGRDGVTRCTAEHESRNPSQKQDIPDRVSELEQVVLAIGDEMNITSPEEREDIRSEGLFHSFIDWFWRLFE